MFSNMQYQVTCTSVFWEKTKRPSIFLHPRYIYSTHLRLQGGHRGLKLQLVLGQHMAKKSGLMNAAMMMGEAKGILRYSQ